ncbi:protein SPT2 homolog [Notolabrus celidotus]|uniref:protein SPT2 homolog n=1 Tax=Notolabrus celidotus TaxID=1203425 RepID=UPI00148F8551|nr:protein SPT2 homolog [Notolabrus celidotus]
MQRDIVVYEIKMRKQKDELLAKRVELKSDRKARAMASRTKDNFRGYNGVPVVDVPKKRETKQEMEEERSMNQENLGITLMIQRMKGTIMSMIKQIQNQNRSQSH